MASREKFELKIDEDGGASKVFAGEKRVQIKAPRKAVVHNLPSYELALERGAKERCVDATGATVTATDRVRKADDGTALPAEPSKKITFRCPGPLLDRLARHVSGPSTAGLAALAEFGLNVLLANRLSLTASRSDFIDLESLFLTTKREARATQLDMAVGKHAAQVRATERGEGATANKAAAAAKRLDAPEAGRAAEGKIAKAPGKKARVTGK